MDPLLVPWEKPLQHVSTLVRQFLIDFIIITGNASLGGMTRLLLFQKVECNGGPIFKVFKDRIFGY